LIDQATLAQQLSSCCQLDSFPVSECTDQEKQFLTALLPGCRSVIVVAHHVKSPVEWMWFPLEAERNQVTCPADLHVKNECVQLISALKKVEAHSAMVPYPGRCGLRFKDLAHKTGLGKIGDSFLFLHREWGPWTHLRVLVTDAVITGRRKPCESVCLHCGLCKAHCPAQVILDDTLLGVRCDEYQDALDGELGIPGNYVCKCEVCARICPIGETPAKIAIAMQ